MKSTTRISLLLVVVLFAAGVAEAGIARVAKRYSMLEFFGGYSTPVGTYEGIGQIDFDNSLGTRINLDADVVYDPSAHFGIGYGRLFNRSMQLTVGFRYTHVKEALTFAVDDLIYTFVPENPSINQWDLDINYNYLFTDISKSMFAPYLGVGMRAGLTSFSGPGVESEAEVDMALAANAGLEFKIYEAPKGRSFVTVASVNSYEFWGSGNRPKYLNIGLALKYYYRM